MVVAKLLLILATSVTASNDSQLLCFGAKWCQPCREMQPTLDRLASEGFPIRKIDVDQYGALAKRYEISAVPAFILVDPQGRKIDGITQATNYDTLRRFFAHYQISPLVATVRGQSPEAIAARRDTDPGSGVANAAPLKSNTPNRNTPTQLSGVQMESLASTVRLRVEDAQGHSFGTGTVVDVHGQEALVLTCGHIFRDSAGKGRILMERFDAQTSEPSTGTLISYDIDRDVALVSMKLTRPIKAARLAPLKSEVRPGDVVYSVGCNQGAHPTVMEGHVNQTDKYLGPPQHYGFWSPRRGSQWGRTFQRAW